MCVHKRCSEIRGRLLSTKCLNEQHERKDEGEIGESRLIYMASPLNVLGNFLILGHD